MQSLRVRILDIMLWQGMFSILYGYVMRTQFAF